MNRKRTRRKTKRKYTRKLSNKKKHTMNRKSSNTHFKSKSKKNRNKHKKGGGAGFVKTLVKKPFQAAQRGIKSMGMGSVDVQIPDGLNMKCGHCNQMNFKIYTINAYGKFLYCDECGAVCGFAARV